MNYIARNTVVVSIVNLKGIANSKKINKKVKKWTVPFLLWTVLFLFYAYSWHGNIVLAGSDNIKKSSDTIRVVLVIDGKSVNVKIDDKFEILASVLGTSAKDKIVGSGSDSLMFISGSSAGIFIGNKNTMKNNLKIISKQNIIEVNSRKYRGNILVNMNQECKITVINELPLEEYLYGVVPLEISSKASFEALRAQAVASRTYAYHQKLKNKGNDYDLSSTVLSQVYGGFDKEKETANNAVDSTEGIVLVYKNEIIYSAFHGNCGGYTENSKSTWNTELPYLKSVRCSYCRDSIHYKWSCSITSENIRIALRNSGYSIGRVIDIEVIDTNSSGRVSDLEIEHADGSLKISGAKFRMSMGPNLIRSANFRVEKENSKFVFNGRGWGHGVGLCQDGAFGMAESGFNFERILEKYYHGADLVKIK